MKVKDRLVLIKNDSFVYKYQMSEEIEQDQHFILVLAVNKKESNNPFTVYINNVKLEQTIK